MPEKRHKPARKATRPEGTDSLSQSKAAQPETDIMDEVKDALDDDTEEAVEGEPQIKVPGDEMPSKSKDITKPIRTKGKKLETLDKKKRIEVLKKFTKMVLKKYGPLIRSIVLFGSTARQEFKGESDIDVFVILDDTRKPR